MTEDTSERDDSRQVIIRDENGQFQETTLDELLDDIGIGDEVVGRLVSLMQGEKIEFTTRGRHGQRGKYTVSYDDDGQGFFYLDYRGPAGVHHDVQFKEVEKGGTDLYWLLTGKNEVGMTIRDPQASSGHFRTFLDLLSGQT